MKKALRILLAAALMLGLATPALAAEPAKSAATAPITILHTNDARAQNLERYASVSAYWEEHPQRRPGPGGAGGGHHELPGL